MNPIKDESLFTLEVAAPTLELLIAALEGILKDLKQAGFDDGMRYGIHYNHVTNNELMVSVELHTPTKPLRFAPLESQLTDHLKDLSLKRD